MKTKFTAGPWRLGKNAMGDEATVWAAKPGLCIVALFDSRMGDDLPPRRENAANAHLIVTAPELFDFIATLENDDGKIPAWLWEKRNALLAKATGETP